MSADDGPGTREVAHRLFAAEFEDADFEYSESDEERAPNYVVTPTGARVNRMFVVGVLTEVETVNENTLRGRVVDPTGAFVSYAGQYQPDEMAFLDRTRPPAFVALTGKARTFQPDDSDVVYTSVRPERFGEVDQTTRDRWTVSAAEATLRRVAVVRDALAMDVRGDALREALEDAGVRPSLAAGVPLALEQYDTGERYLEAVRQAAVQALEVVAGDRDEVEPLDTEPDARGGGGLGPLPEGVPGSVSADTSPAGDTDATADGTDASDTTAESTGAQTAQTTTAGDAGESAASDEIDEFDTGEVAESFADADDATATDDGGSGTETAAVGGTSDDGSTDDVTSDETEKPTTSADTATPSDGSETDDVTDPGSFEAGGFETDDGADDDLGSFDPEEDALTEEERQEVEEEFGVDFSSGSEVPDPEESDLDAPDPEEITPDPATEETAAAGSGADAGTVSDESSEPAETTPDETEASATTESAGDTTDDVVDDPTDDSADDATDDVDLTTAVVDIMTELDEGDGADREKVMAAAVERHGATPDAVEDAVQDALMNGQCYEAGGGLKPI